MTGSTPAVAPLLLTSREAAAALSISERSLFSLRTSGAIRCVKIGPAGVRYSVDELRRFIAESMPAAAEGGDA